VAETLVLFTVVPAVVLCAIHYGFRKLVPPEHLIPHHDVAGFLIAVVGVIYAVVLGFVVVTVWVSFDTAQRTADLEASDAAELFTLARAFPQPARGHLEHSLADYAFEVRDREWPLLSSGNQDQRARQIYLTAVEEIMQQPHGHASVADEVERVPLQDRALSTLHDLSTHRRERLIDAGTRLPTALYAALVVGAVFVLAFVFLFGVERTALQLTMTAIIAASIGLLFGVIVCLDRPYSGAMRVSPDAWTLIIENNDLERFRTIR
jgi:Protein of unknown function (DUF4239)